MKKISDEQTFGEIFRPGGDVEPMPEPAAEGKFSLEELQEAVGGYIEGVPGHLGEGAGRVLVGTVVVIPSGRMD